MEVMPDDLKFPKAVIARIIKDALPEGAKVSKEAQSAISRSAAIFILHATSFANDHAQSKKRKNVTAEDVFHAVKQLECEELEDSIIEGLEMFKKKRVDRLQKRSENNANKKREIEKQAGTSSNVVESPEPGEEDEEEEEEENGAMEVSDEEAAANGEEEQQEQNGEDEQEDEENEEADEENNEDDDDVVEVDEEEDE